MPPDKVILQKGVKPDDAIWVYRNIKIPQTNLSEKEDKVQTKFITVTEDSIELKIEYQSINRVFAADDSPENFIGISFANFRFKDFPPRITADYIERLLKEGIQINSTKYYFYGHSNSQLKSRTGYLYAANNGEELFRKINTFGDFSKIASVAKRAKRIGLLFSAAESQIKLDQKYTLDIDDIESANGHIFTDGCGLIIKHFAAIIARKTKIIFHNVKYIPSVFQLRYKGYKGTVMVHPALPSPHHFHFVKSMKKFSNCSDNTFSVLDYSKPYSFGFLNGELVTLLSTLGIKDDILLTKQKNYFDFLKGASTDPRLAFMYLSYKGENGAAENILLNGMEKSTLSLINRLKREEWKGSYDKRDKEKVRILIPCSRLLFGVADHAGVLKEGEVHVRIKVEGMQDMTLDNAAILVGRNPCLHPGDIRKFKAVFKEELSHLVDCIVFPTVGERDAPSLMSGGDLDGDKFFVSWDEDIIPEVMYEPYGYPAAKESPRREINYETMVRYFAQYNNASLGKVKNLYLQWVRVSDVKAGSKECQELNSLFSCCVDGERIKIPTHLQAPPKLKEGSKPFILDLLCTEVEKHANIIFQSETEVESAIGTPYELMEFLLTSHSVCLDEFELFKLANLWCMHNEYPIEDFLHCFNFGAFNLQEKHIIAAQFKQRGMQDKYFRPLFNSLYYSNLLTEEDIKSQNLHHKDVHWQKFYDSHDDDGLRLEANLSKALELFEKKLLVLRVDADLVIAIYMSHKIIPQEVMEIGKLAGSVKLFAFPNTGQPSYRSYAERKYKIHFDGNIIQLYDQNRPNTFVWFALQNDNFPSNRISQPIKSNIRMTNRGISDNNATKNVKKSEFKVSIALQKFSGELAKSRSRVTKQESKGIEIYVISNRDRVGHQLLDLTMSQVDTKTTVKLEKNTPKSYNSSVDLESIYWEHRDFCKGFFLNGPIFDLHGLNNICQLEQIFFICETISDGDVGDRVFLSIVEYTLVNFDELNNRTELWEEIFRHIHLFPTASSLIVDKIYESTFHNDDGHTECPIYPIEEYQLLFLMHGIIQSANSLRELVFQIFQKLVLVILHRKITFSVKELISLVKSIVYSVRHSDIAEWLLHELFKDDLPIFQFTDSNTSENEICFRYLKKFTIALALDHLGEVSDNCPCDRWGVPHGAEDIEEEATINQQPNYKRHAEKPVLADFMNQLFFGKHGNGNSSGNGSDNVNMDSFRGAKPKPVMKCLVIEPTDKLGFYKTILRIDILNKIRNGDHLRFCASRRAVDNSKRRVSVFSAIADSIKGGELIFQMKEREPRELFAASWNVYICTSTTTFNAMLVALRTLISSKDRSTSAFRSILELPPLPPEMGTYFERKEVDIPPTKKFNEMQMKAIKEAINGPLTLIWGPPGSGKTTVVVEILLQFISLRKGETILVTASTHNAVDNVLSRFLKEREKRFGDGKSEDVVRITSDISKVEDPALQKWTLNAFVGADIHTNDKAKREALKRLQNARLVFSTCSGAGVGLLRLQDDDKNDDDDSEGKKKKKQKEQTFDVVIVDEASQITEPNALIPIIKKSQYVILVGDHVQLRPTVSQIAKDYGLETTLFEKLYLSPIVANSSCTKVMLNVQYRMNPLLAKFPSNAFYEGKLLSGINEGDRTLPKSKFPWPSLGEGQNGIFPLVFINCSSPESYGTGSTSKMNIGQITLTLKIIKDLLNQTEPEITQAQRCSITVLSPYTKQLAEIKTKMKAANLKVDVKTIDSFQGRESDIVIYSTVRANNHGSLGFLDDRRRMNVALTRAKFGMIIIGDEETLKGNELWAKCINSCEKVDHYNPQNVGAVRLEPRIRSHR